MIELCRMVDAADVALPVAGGMLDQADVFLDAMRVLRASESRIVDKRTRGSRGT